VMIDGVPHSRLVVASPVRPITLFVNSKNGRIAKLTTHENDHLFRDTTVTVQFEAWRSSGCGVRFPTHVTVSVDGTVIADETRAVPQTGVTIAPDAVAFPAGAAPSFVEADAAFGERDFHFHSLFASFGFRLDPIQNFVDAAQLSPGVFVLGGASHKSMAIEQQNGIVIIEAPLYAERSQAILAWVARQFPGKRVTHVVSTHFHDDHSGGLRDFVAAGATVVCGPGSEGFYEKAFTSASTIVPDALARDPRPATIVRVTGSTVLADAVNPISVEAISNSHANDLVLVRLPQQNIAFESDLYSPGFPPGVLPSANQVELYNALLAGGHTSDLIVGGHGGNATFADLKAALP
jgi:glyoxylase-like metal-dependent hydrolase (beta-lactamase superfamily II)